jgi:hypothetical protein
MGSAKHEAKHAFIGTGTKLTAQNNGLSPDMSHYRTCRGLFNQGLCLA